MAAKRQPDFGEQVGLKAARKLRAQRVAAQGFGFGISLMGIVGWSVSVPTLLGIALGTWLDQHHPGAHSWTLALLMAGLSAGCLLAWHWVDRESQVLRREGDSDRGPDPDPPSDGRREPDADGLGDSHRD